MNSSIFSIMRASSPTPFVFRLLGLACCLAPFDGKAGDPSPSFLKILSYSPFPSVLLGNSAYADGDLDKAREHFKHSIEITFKRLDTDPDNPVWQTHLSDGYNMLGVIASDQAKYSEAERWHTLNLSILKKQCTSKPEDINCKINLANCYYKIGDVHVLDKKPGNALLPYSDGLAIHEALASANPENSRVSGGISIGKERLGSLAIAFGRLHEGNRLYQENFLIRKKLHALDPENPATQSNLASACHLNAGLAAKLQKWDAALENCSHAVVLWHAIAKKNPNSKRPQNQLKTCYVLLGDINASQAKPKLAEKSYLMALQISKQIADTNPNDPVMQRELAELYRRLAMISEALDNKPQSTKYWELSQELLRHMQAKGTTLTQKEIGFLQQ